jgi:uncharacterized membrane protein YbaN (DUF454 family)
MKRTIIDDGVSGKIVACGLVLALVVVGVIGLVVPIIPGLLFLAIAAFVAAKHLPAVDAQLRRSRTLREHLDKAHRASTLALPAKLQLAAWFCVKTFVDGVALVASFVAKLRTPAG